MRWFTVAVVLASLLPATACSELTGGDDDPELEFEFTSLAEPGFIDQSITITNPTSEPLTATYVITPLDAQGDEVTGVEVATAYGSNLGEMALMPGENIDVLVLSGEQIRDVEDISVSDASTEEADILQADKPVTVDPWGIYDQWLTLDNPNRKVSVAVALLVYDLPVEGEPQQVIEVVQLLPPTEIERGNDEQVQLSEAALRALNKYSFDNPTSTKAYFAPIASSS